MWPRFNSYVVETESMDPAKLARRAETRVIDSRVRALTHNLPVLKVKIYNPSGMTVYSSQTSQIGEDQRDNQGFVTARGGEVISALTHRDEFDEIGRAHV